MNKLLGIFLESKNKEKSGVIWNMAANMMFAFQSPLMFFVYRLLKDDYLSSTFRAIFTLATLFFMIAKFGLRDYQISDLKNKYSFFDYKSTKYLTIVLMLVVSIICAIYKYNIGQFTYKETLCLLLFCLLKAQDAIEEVYYAHYQKNLRLDIAGKTMFARLIISTIAILVVSVITRSLFAPLLVGNIVSGAFIVFCSYVIYPRSKVIESDLKPFAGRNQANSGNPARIIPILKVGFPLFLGLFLAYYMSAAAVDAINLIMDDVAGTVYAVLSMPVFVIGLISDFIYTPLIVRLTEAWRKRDLKKFFKMIYTQILVIVGITIVCVAGAYLLGVPVLSFVFTTDIAPYKMDLLILLVGGGLLALAKFLVSVTTVIRFHKATAIGYIIGGVATYIITKPMVSKYGIRGATTSFMYLMILLCVCFAVIFIIGYKKNVNKIVNK